MVEPDAAQSPSWRYLAAWYAASAGLLLVLPVWKSGFAVWLLPRPQWLPFACLAAAFVLSAACAALLAAPVRTVGLITLCTTAVFSVVFLAFLLTKADYSRGVTLAAFLAAIVLVPAPYALAASPWSRTLAMVALLGVTAASPFALGLLREVPSKAATLVKTEYYNLDVETYSGLFPKSVVHGGALARLGNSYLLLTGDGHLDVFRWQRDSERPQVTVLPYRVPLNGEEFAAAAGRPWAIPPGEGPAREDQQELAHREILNSETFRTYGILVQNLGSDTRIFVSHAYWHGDRQCWVERVSMLEGEQAALLRGTAKQDWRTLFETTPCLPVSGQNRRHGIPFVGYFGGGRMALLNDRTLLLTVGDFGFDGLASVEAMAQDPATSYGKTLAIDIGDGHASLFTLGHRNPEGLFIDRSGVIWSTEHGPQGGDELNRLVRGGNYGWPYATYGTDYGAFKWPLNKSEAEQNGYQAPVFSWVPSIGVSNLVAVERDLFTQWRGDLLIASLRAQTLYRAHLHDGNVAYVESIAIGSRIRDLIEGHDGRILLWNDDDTLVSLRPKTGSSGEMLFAEKCSGCHQSTVVSGNRIGPNLAGVLGRRVASLESYPDYSPSLRRLGGVWTEARLDAFLADPRTLCPGTAMDFAGDPSASERSAIIGYLRDMP